MNKEVPKTATMRRVSAMFGSSLPITEETHEDALLIKL